MRYTSNPQGDYDHYVVPQQQPLLEFLLENVKQSRSKIKATLQGQGIKVNGKTVTKFDYLLQPGMKVAVSRTKRNQQAFKNRFVKIVYEDRWLIVIEKQAGILSMAAGHFTESYMPLGNLRIDYDSCAVENYVRTLDLARAVATVSYLRDGALFRSEVFASAPDSAIVMHIVSEAPLNARVSLDTRLPHEIQASEEGLTVDGYAPWHTYPNYYPHRQVNPEKYLYDPERGIHFRTRLAANVSGGTMKVDEGALVLEGVREATLYVVNATSFNGFDKDPVKEGKP